MATILVIGAGLGGLSTAMVLARDGHDVTVLERDPAPPPSTPEEAWTSWERRGVNQFRLPHFLLARWRQEAERELPDAVAALDAWGARRWNAVDALPGELRDGGRPGDDAFDFVTARRPVIEGALARTAAATFGITIERGVAVAGLLTGGTASEGVPHVTGLATADGGRRAADLVVDTSGRRSPLGAWLEAIGARPPHEEREDSGFVYYGRHYRGEMPAPRAALLQTYESVSILTLPCDNETWCTVVVASARDAALRRLRDPERFDAVLDLYPCAAEFRHGEPISDIAVMTRIEDRYRRFVVDDQPVVTGLVAVADAWACTNPSLGRGASIGLLHAAALRDLLREVPPGDGVGFARRWDEVTEATVTPYYRATLAFDRHRLAEIQSEVEGRPYETDDPAWAMTTALMAGATRDPVLARAQQRIAQMLDLPPQVVSDPDVFERVIAASELPRYPLPGADRETLLATVTGSLTGVR